MTPTPRRTDHDRFRHHLPGGQGARRGVLRAHRRLRGGTCFITDLSDIDFDVPTANLAALTAALDAAGLPYRATPKGAVAD